MSPKVSVVMAAHDGAALLPATLETLFAQTLTDWELIVADDCSGDGTRALLAGYADPRIKLVPLAKRCGPAIARNQAFARASGDYIAGLEPGDLCHPERFARQVARLDVHSDTVLVSSSVGLRPERGAHRAALPASGLSPAQIDWLLHLGNPLVWSSVLFRADAARRLDSFQRPGHGIASDFDLYHRLRPFGGFAQIREELTIRRAPAGGASAEHRAATARVLAAAHQALLEVPAPEATDLIADHVMARRPVPDLATLHLLFDVIAILRDELIDARGYGRGEQVAIDRLILDLWWECARAGVRAGALPLREALAASPVPPDIARKADFYVAGLVGQVRALRG
jgi:glycosyltransferase involved in cell wall biosynthesis